MIVGRTGWTWREAGTLTIPRLRALSRHWRRHPSADELLAAYLNFTPPDDDPAPVQTSADDEPAADDGALPAWAHGMPAMPAPEALRQAETPEARIAAWERLFFGEVKDVEQL